VQVEDNDMTAKNEKLMVDFPKIQINAVRTQAEVDAERVCAFLKPFNEARWPLEFVVELAAALRVQKWRSGGLFNFLDSHRENAIALSRFFEKMEANDTSWSPNVSGPSAQQVFVSWLRNFAWSAPKDLGADCLLNATSEIGDDEIFAIATLLWKVRHAGAPERR
jgi:hypothetical protein